MRDIFITGRVVNDAQVKVTTAGRQYIEFRFANNERTDKEGNTFWCDVRGFEPGHIKLSQYITKGKPLFLQGRYENSTYQRKDGTYEIDNKIIITKIDFIDFGKPQQNDAQSSHQTPTVTSHGPSATQAAKRTPEPLSANAVQPQAAVESADVSAEDLPF